MLIKKPSKYMLERTPGSTSARDRENQSNHPRNQPKSLKSASQNPRPPKILRVLSAFVVPSLHPSASRSTPKPLSPLPKSPKTIRANSRIPPPPSPYPQKNSRKFALQIGVIRGPALVVPSLKPSPTTPLTGRTGRRPAYPLPGTRPAARPGAARSAARRRYPPLPYSGTPP